MSIYEACRDAAAGHGPGRIDRVRVAVGELTAVEPDLLVFAWEAATADGRDAGAKLEVQWCRAHQHCPSCGEDKPRAEGGWLRLCPDCGQVLEVDGGDELDLLELTYVTDDGPLEDVRGEAGPGSTS
jgi:Zn finger protein HypA/HybF involved in hydrogenase expression